MWQTIIETTQKKLCVATGPAQKRHPHLNLSVNLRITWVLVWIVLYSFAA